MKITQQDDGRQGVFLAEQDGRPAGKLSYVWQGEAVLVIEHTEVEAHVKGQGVGRQLLNAAVDFARARGVSILPQCSFALAVFNKQADLHDVWHHPHA